MMRVKSSQADCALGGGGGDKCKESNQGAQEIIKQPKKKKIVNSSCRIDSANVMRIKKKLISQQRQKNTSCSSSSKSNNSNQKLTPTSMMLLQHMEMAKKNTKGNKKASTINNGTSMLSAKKRMSVEKKRDRSNTALPSSLALSSSSSSSWVSTIVSKEQGIQAKKTTSDIEPISTVKKRKSLSGYTQNDKQEEQIGRKRKRITKSLMSDLASNAALINVNSNTQRSNIRKTKSISQNLSNNEATSFSSNAISQKHTLDTEPKSFPSNNNANNNDTSNCLKLNIARSSNKSSMNKKMKNFPLPPPSMNNGNKSKEVIPNNAITAPTFSSSSSQMQGQDKTQYINANKALFVNERFGYRTPSTNNNIEVNKAMMNTQTTQPSKAKQKNTSNDNFVRLDMRNSSGACKGARNKKSKFHNTRYGNNKYNKNTATTKGTADQGPKFDIVSNSNVGIDPLDELIDSSTSKTKAKAMTTGRKENMTKRSKKSSIKSSTAVCCIRHERKCKISVVKTNKNGNKGRKFYVCSLPRGEQCNFFQWCDDEDDEVVSTVVQLGETHQKQNKSCSSSINNLDNKTMFLKRRVKMYSQRFQKLTIPELKQEAIKYGCFPNKSALQNKKKKEIVTKLLIWVRDEISKSLNGLSVSSSSSRESTKKSSSSSSIQSLDSRNPILSSSLDEKDMEYNTDTDSDSNEGDTTDEDDTDLEDELDIIGGIKSVGEERENDNDITKSPTAENIEVEAHFLHHKSPIHKALYDLYGYTEFRDGQEWAINRCLSNKDSLLVAATGMGKSLCYILPTYMNMISQSGGITIVISPLVSLMQDQIMKLPPCIPAATLSGHHGGGGGYSSYTQTIKDILEHRIQILFCSPERICSASFRRLLAPGTSRKLPPVNLLCVDEAHLCSAWGHNFRPSYLRLGSIVKRLLQPRSILALTATAGPDVIQDICRTFKLGVTHHQESNHISLFSSNSSDKSKDENLQSTGSDIAASSSCVSNEKFDTTVSVENKCVKVLEVNRENIDVSCLMLENQEERLNMLFTLLQTDEGTSSTTKSTKNKNINVKSNTPNNHVGLFSKGLVIIYVWRQWDAEILTEQILTKSASIHSKSLSSVVCYHGGMKPGDRERAQSKFLRGKARICVATVAFGLGIDIQNVNGIIHMCLPPSLENYLQEIGRSGRDGKTQARAISLITPKDVFSRQSLAHSNGITRYQLRIFLQILKKEITDVAKEYEKHYACLTSDDNIDIYKSPLDIAFSVSQVSKATDMKKETVETLLSLLENNTGLFESSFLSVEMPSSSTSDQAIVILKKRSLSKLASMNEPIAQIIELIGRCCSNHSPESTTTTSSSAPHVPDAFHYRSDVNMRKSDRSFHAYSHGSYQFSIIGCARLLGPQYEPRHVFAILRRLQNCGELELALDTSMSGKSISYLKITPFGLCHFLPCLSKFSSSDSELAPQETHTSSKPEDKKMEKILDIFMAHIESQEHMNLKRAKEVYYILLQLASLSGNISSSEVDSSISDTERQQQDQNKDDRICVIDRQKSQRLSLFKKVVSSYFSSKQKNVSSGICSSGVDEELQDQIEKLEQRMIKEETHNNNIESYRMVRTQCEEDPAVNAMIRRDVLMLLQDPVLLAATNNHNTNSQARRRNENIPLQVYFGSSSSSNIMDCPLYTARVITRIFHSVDSVCAPSRSWHSHPLWGKWQRVSFEHLNAMIVKMIQSQKQ